MKIVNRAVLRAVLFCLAFFLLNASQAVELAGLDIAETIQVPAAEGASTTLKLNGAGVRYKVFFKVYVAALYLTETKNTAERIFELAGPKQMNLTMLRNLKSESLAQAFNEGVKRNTTPDEMEKFKSQFSQLNQLFSTVPELKKGDVVSIAWLPDEGTTILLNGKAIGKTLPDGAFFNALLRIWLGNDPVSASLKIQLLGGPGER